MNKALVRFDVVEQYPNERCVFCGKPASDLHHAIIGHKKSLDKKLFIKYNLVPSCNDCNARKRIGDTPEYHHYFWIKHCKIYGEQVMVEWLALVNEDLNISYTPELEPPDYDVWQRKQNHE